MAVLSNHAALPTMCDAGGHLRLAKQALMISCRQAVCA